MTSIFLLALSLVQPATAVDTVEKKAAEFEKNSPCAGTPTSFSYDQ